MQGCWSFLLGLCPEAQSRSRHLRGIEGALVLSLFLLVHDTCGDYNTCSVGLSTPGVTIPRGDVLLEYGEPLRILCILNVSHSAAVGKNSSDLVFFHDSNEIPHEFVTVVNSTTLEIYVEKPPISSSMYYCKLKTNNIHDLYTAVCLNKVVVDRKPQEVQNFSCISRNWENLTCSWKKPHSFITTTYDLSFRLPGRAGGRIRYRCPQIVENETDSFCFWDLTTDPHYRQPYEYYYFTLSGRNTFGNWTKQIKFHHYCHVIPAPPPDLMIVNVTVTNATLEWPVPFPLQIFPPGLTPKVEYQSTYDERGKWLVANMSSVNRDNETYRYILDGLKYANTLYDVRVYLSSKLALGEDKWSAPAINTFRTKPTIPGAVPRTDIGSFEVSGGLPNRDVYIYWQHIPDHLKNGENFEYKIISVKENGHERSLTPNETTNAYAKFRGISFNSFRFKIVAANREGYSKDVSEVYVPSKTELPAEPVSFTKIAFDNGEYELSWKPPASAADRSKIENYTIFWCNHERDRPYQCTGFLNWTHVPRNVTLKKIHVSEDKIYQFAISANTKNASSGMVWASCTVIHNKVVGKMKSVWINRIGSTYIEVGWKLDCSDRIGTVQGFNIYYCPIVSPYNLSCKEHELNTTVMGDPLTIHGNITNLKPYTIYMVAIAVITQSGEGLQSEPLYNTTLEAAPVAPGPVNITEITNTSMIVTWQPPNSLNGALRNYDIFYGSRNKRLNMNTNEKPETIPVSVKLENLTSFYNYTVSVVACTTACSEKSQPVTVQTDIGVPGVMERPTVQIINSSMVLVSWKPPHNRGGLLNYYEVTAIKVDEDSERNETHLYNTTATESQIPVPDCETEGYLKYLFLVRAVNVGANNVTFHGNWSSPGESNCYSSAIPKALVIVIWVCGTIIFLTMSVFFCYMVKRAWLRCKEMQDVEVKLPPGLAPSEKEKDHEYWPPVDTRDHILGKPRSNASADEEYLLDKKEERHGRNPIGDCRNESVSSSLKSGTQFCDSGIEVDQHPPSPDGVFPDVPTWKSSSVTPSLRQRNVASFRPDGNSDGSYVDSCVKMVKGIGNGEPGSVAHSTPNLTEGHGIGAGPGGVGTGDTCLGKWSSTGYISMSSGEDMGGTGDIGPAAGSAIDLTSGLGTAGEYCVVGMRNKPVEGQRLQQIVQPHKAYVRLASNSPSTSTANSSTHLSPHQPLQQPPGLQQRGYVSHHHPLWPASKETSGKGFVVAGDLANKASATSESLLTSEFEEENQGILTAGLSGRGDVNHENEELCSPESYSHFGLHPGMIHIPMQIPVPSNIGMMEEILQPEQEKITPKPGSGYVTLSDEPRLQKAEPLGMISGRCNDQRAGVSRCSGGAVSGYVPHRQLEERGALALNQTATYQDYTEEPYTKVFPPNIDDASLSTSV